MNDSAHHHDGDDYDPGKELARAYAAAIRPIVHAMLEPYRIGKPDAYAQFIRQAALGETQLHLTGILSNKPMDLVLRMVTAEAVAPIAVWTMQGGILTLSQDGAQLN